jgi:hypothetical protein
MKSKIEELLKEAKRRWELNSYLMRIAKRDKDYPSAQCHSLAVARYIRIHRRLEESLKKY